jgi:hypothetical protein
VVGTALVYMGSTADDQSFSRTWLGYLVGDARLVWLSYPVSLVKLLS